MNTKNRLQKITIILAIFLILFNFMGSTMVYATITISEDVIEWIQTNTDAKSDSAAKEVAEAFDVDGVTGIVINNGNFEVKYNGSDWKVTENTINNNLSKTYIQGNEGGFLANVTVSITNNNANTNNTNTNNTNNSNKNNDTSDDPVANWILKTYSDTLYDIERAKDIKNAILNTEGVTGISINGDKLH